MPAKEHLSLREQKKEETRRALARASAELLLNEGSDGMTVAAVAERAGVSTRTFHNYFPRREDALLFFLEETIDDLRKQVDEAPDDEHPLDVMHRLIAGRLEGEDDPGTLLNLRSIADHLSYIAGPEDREKVMHLADDLLEALYRRSSDTLSRSGCALMMVSCLAAGAVAVEGKAARDGSCTVLFPRWATSDREPSDVLDEGFGLLRSGFGD